MADHVTGDSPRRTQVVATARELLERDGPAGLTMRAVAERVGIKAPSLYKHFPDKADLETALIAQAFEETAAVFGAATRAGREPLVRLATAYRGWAVAHPHLYRLMTTRPLDRDRLPAGVEDAAARPVVDAVGGDVDLARAAWGLAHGLTALELDGRFPPGADVDAAWDAGIAALRQAAGSGAAYVATERGTARAPRIGGAVPSKSSNVKNEKQYEALKDKGMSKQRAAKIANSPDASKNGGKKSGSGGDSSQGGTTAQKKKAGSKGGKATAKKNS